MGSRSNSTSNTNYTNAPLTLQDNREGLALAGNTGLQLGGFGNVNGSTHSGNNSNNVLTETVSNVNNSGSFQTNYSTLDGGAIQRAFDATDKSISAIVDLTAKVVEQSSGANIAALGFTEKANAAALAAATPQAQAASDFNKTLVYAVVAVGIAFAVKFWGK